MPRIISNVIILRMSYLEC